MDRPVHKTIVVSAVNIRKGGTLTVLRDCLRYLSENHARENRIIALVHNKALCEYPGIEYLEFPDTIKNWGKRLWCEYVTMNKVSKRIAEEDGRKVWMWLSMHDTTPRVQAEHQEVYCHTSFPFMKPNLRDFKMDPKIPLFCMFTRFAYRINVHKNDYLIVQQEWFRDAMSTMLGVPEEKFKVIPPAMPDLSTVEAEEIHTELPTFLYVSTPDCHKNFETLCEAARLLEKEVGTDKFKVVITVKGDENKYATWLKSNWGDVKSIDFHGLMKKPELFGWYKAATALVFPSRVETWGLPISEFMAVGNGKMLLADLPYAHETSKGAKDAIFFEACNANALKERMSTVLWETNNQL